MIEQILAQIANGQFFLLGTIHLEFIVNTIESRDAPNFHSQKVAEKLVHVFFSLHVGEEIFHGIPEMHVNVILFLGSKPHEDIVANEIRLGELLAGGVQALEDGLSIVLCPVQGDIDNLQLLN